MDETELLLTGERYGTGYTKHRVNQVTPFPNVLHRNWRHLSWHGSDLGFNPGSSLSVIKELNHCLFVFLNLVMLHSLCDLTSSLTRDQT